MPADPKTPLKLAPTPELRPLYGFAFLRLVVEDLEAKNGGRRRPTLTLIEGGRDA